jgi:hypothetical protein
MVVWAIRASMYRTGSRLGRERGRDRWSLRWRQIGDGHLDERSTWIYTSATVYYTKLALMVSRG